MERRDTEVKKVRIQEVRQIVCSASFLSGHSGKINGICSYSKDKMATGGEDGTIRLWDLASMESLGCLRGHSKGIRALISLPNGNLVSGSSDKTIRIWNTSVAKN